MEDYFISLLKIEVSHLLCLSVCNSSMGIRGWGAGSEDCRPLETREERQPFLPVRAPEEKRGGPLPGTPA